MKKDFIKYFAMASLLTGCFACSDADHPDEGSEQPSIPVISLTAEEIAAKQAVTVFNYDFLGACDRSRNNRDENLLISPLSAQMALGMLASAANEVAASEIAAALGCDDNAALAGMNGKILRTLPKLDSKVKFNLANSVWHENGYTLSSAFTKNLSSTYSVEIFPCKMADAADDINAWCALKTENNINNLVTPQSLSNSVLAMLNALYFKGEWAEIFDKSKTRSYAFHGSAGDTTVDMMVDTREVIYTTNLSTSNNQPELGYECVELPFGNGSFTVKFVLPAEDADINALADNASSLIPTAETNKLKKRTLYLPKFKLEGTQISLNEALDKMGIRCIGSTNHFSIFDDDALNNLNFIVSQQSTAEFDEEGAVVASATKVVECGDSGFSNDIIFDRPFLFFITETQTGACLMAGKVMNL